MSDMLHPLADSIDTKKGYAFKSAWFSEIGIPVVKAKDFTANSISLADCDFLSLDRAKDFEKYSLVSDEIVVQTVGSWPSSPASMVGKCIRVPAEAEGALLNQNTVILTPSSELDSNYLYYSLKSERFRSYIANVARGSANQASITLKDIRDFQIHKRHRSEQENIGLALRAYDDLIENNRRRIALLEESARLLYREWFVHLRFPKHETTTIIDGVPEGWDATDFESVCETIGGGTPSTKVPEYWADAEVTWVTPTDITRNNCLALLDGEKNISLAGLKKSSAKLVPPNTILMTSRASVGFFGLIDKEVCTNQGFINIIPNVENYRYYLLFNLINRVEEIRAHAGGSTYAEISKGKFRRLPVIKPSDIILEKFDSLSRPIIDQVRALKKQSSELEKARDILLPRLMDGRVEL